MATECARIRFDLKNNLRRVAFNQYQANRLKSFSHMMLKISDTSLNTTWSNQLINKCNAFVKSLETTFSNILDQKITEMEHEIVCNLIAELKIPFSDVNNFLSEARSGLGIQYSLDELLPRFLTSWLKKTSFISNIISQADGLISLQYLFTSFNIPFNNFVKKVATKVLGLNDDFTYQTSELYNFLSLFFGSFQNYKFYVKAARIIENFPFKDLTLGSPFRYRILLTVENKNYTGANNVLKIGQAIMSGGLGINSINTRSDGLVLFGKHPHADIVFPNDDPSVDYLNCILVNCQDNVYIIDTSKKSNCGIKLENNIYYHLEAGSLLNLAKNLTFYIDSNTFKDRNPNFDSSNQSKTFEFDDDNYSMISEVVFTCIEGVYKENTFKITNATRNPGEFKKIHVFGCGGGDKIIDFYIPRETGVSRSQLSFVYDDNELRWNVLDEGSTNGTYFLLKNKKQFEAMQPSNHRILFNSLIQGGNSTIMVGKYIFYLMIE